MNQATYRRLAVMAEDLVTAGFPVIVDATFLKKADRLVFAQWANRHQILLRIIDVTAPESVRSQRIQQRRQEGRDASEATESVMQRQVEQDEPFGQEEEPLVMTIDSTGKDSLQSPIRQLSQLLSVYD